MKFANSLRNLLASTSRSAKQQFARAVDSSARGPSAHNPQKKQEIASSRLPGPTPIPPSRRPSSRNA
ncbi:MAG: hypothetical protein WA783_20265 [Phormidesmis sp.]